MSRLVPILALPALLFATATAAAEGKTLQQTADREALRNAIEEVLARPPLNDARVGVQIASLDTGEVVYASHADDLLNPASNVKLFTSAAALARLGPEYRYQTEFLTDAPIKDGKVRVLYVRGKGDPTITTERLYNMVSELAHTGLKEVHDIVIDDTWFDDDRVPPGYDQEDSDRAYMAPPGAVSLNWNAVGIFVRAGEKPGDPAVVEIDPPSEFFVVESSLTTTGQRRSRLDVRSEPLGDKQRVRVTGTITLGRASWVGWKKIDNPPMYFGYTLKALLQQRGVKVRGRVKLGQVAPDARLLYLHQSDTLDLVLKKLNKDSQNFIAEQLLKTLAAEVKGPPGTTQKGVEVVEEFLAQDVGIARGTYVMKNGSGLNDTNRFSPAQTTKLLCYMAKQIPMMPEYLSTLGIAGKDGTVRRRFEGTDAVGRLRAKTGTLENVSALSGYVVGVGGERFVFSIMVNDYDRRAGSVIKGLDAMGAAVAAVGGSEGPTRAVAEALTDDVRPGSLDEARARIRTYLLLGRQADKRNIAFLRTAWRNEKDPAVRVVVAESLYRSDPQDYLAARALLDSFSATPEVYGRLRQVAKDLEIDVPGVSSVIDLAAEGNPDALAHLVDLAKATGGDEGAQKELAEALADVSRTAPTELLVTLRRTPPADREAAIALLARGFVAAADPEHPFWAALKRAMGAVDGELSAFARQMETTLSKKIAEARAPALPAETSANAESAPASASSPLDPPVADTRPGG